MISVILTKTKFCDLRNNCDLQITLDEIIDTQPSILSRWKKYRIQMRSVAHNTTQFPVSEFRLQIFENLLKDLHHQLLLKTLFLKAIDRTMDINKNSVMSGHFMSYLRNILADIENKNSENYSFDKNWARLNVGIVVASKLFGANDRKLIKRIHEVNKKFYALTLAGNVVWIPNKILEDCLPKDVVSSIGSQVGEKVLTVRIQKLQATANSLIHRAMLWSIEVQSVLFTSGFQVLQIERQCFLLSEVLVILRLIKENVLFVTNLHAALSKPMTRSTVQLICRYFLTRKYSKTI